MSSRKQVNTGLALLSTNGASVEFSPFMLECEHMLLVAHVGGGKCIWMQSLEKY